MAVRRVRDSVAWVRFPALRQGMRKHLDIKLHGRVHGVGFRFLTKKVCDKLGILGFVRNERDTVYIEAEGEAEDLEKFLDWCRKGPPLAKVEKVETGEGEFKNFTDFSII